MSPYNVGSEMRRHSRACEWGFGVNKRDYANRRGHCSTHYLALLHCSVRVIIEATLSDVTGKPASLRCDVPSSKRREQGHCQPHATAPRGSTHAFGRCLPHAGRQSRLALLQIVGIAVAWSRACWKGVGERREKRRERRDIEGGEFDRTGSKRGIAGDMSPQQGIVMP